MAETIQAIFVNPPIAIARLGGSLVPQDAYVWVDAPQPRASANTTIAPAWSLSVQPDGTVKPILPIQIVLRDGQLIRPVCPFFEVWARLGEPGSDASTWRDVPLTPELLIQFGVGLSALSIQLDAKNFKAARRTGNAALRFGTFPPLQIPSGNHAPVPIKAASPPNVPEPMIPRGRHIPMGSVQMMRSSPQPTGGVPWIDDVNVAVIRFRFTPAQGHVYGVPASAKRALTSRRRKAVPVEVTRAFLNPRAGWADVKANNLVVPPQTYDGADVRGRGARSLGVVDDTCEARFEVSLQMPGNPVQIFKASAEVFVGPPDFAPDRRPFLSLADEISDRGADAAARTNAMTPIERDAWVQDLFERIFETVSLLNVDLYRELGALTLRGNRLRKKKIPHDGVPEPANAMGGRDALRSSSLLPVDVRTPEQPLPLSEHARARHRQLSNLVMLRDFIAENPGRIAKLVRASFEVEHDENANVSTMRMPPFMRNSNALPLTLAAWQYDLLMGWVKSAEAAAQAKPSPKLARGPAPISPIAAKRRAAVLNRVRTTGEGSKR